MTLFRYYPERGIFRNGPWRREWMFVGRGKNWLLRGFRCADCPGATQWYGWKWIVRPGYGPWIGPARSRAQLIGLIQKRERPDLKLVGGLTA